MNNSRGKISIKAIIYIIIVMLIVFIGVMIYSKYNFNAYVKGVREGGKTSFTRDSEIKYSDTDSYKIENTDFNDSMFYKTIEVVPNTPYKITCMVKTENVENRENKYTGGAQIVINNTTECSKALSGTNDWTELTFMFNSNNRTEVEIGFRLGGYEEYSKGIAWFSDFKIEEGTIDADNNWNMACFIIQNLDVNVDNRNIRLSMSEEDISTIEDNMERIKDSISEISGNQMSITYDIIQIDEPLTSLSYDEENEYYVGPEDVQNLIDMYVNQEEYDYIYVAVRLGDLSQSNELLVHDWIGLGAMEYNQIGFSNIRLPDNQNSRIYEYSTFHTFPEEVFVHEFLHTLERNELENGNDIARLHDYAIYGYEESPVSGLKDWYSAYMQNNIEGYENKGLTEFAYNSKPIHESNFKYGIELDYLDEPDNILEELNSIINRFSEVFRKKE